MLISFGVFSNAINSFLPAAFVSCLKVWVCVQHEETLGFSVYLPPSFIFLSLEYAAVGWLEALQGRRDASREECMTCTVGLYGWRKGPETILLA